MGYGEVGSNGSVHWQIGYEDRPASGPDHTDYDTVTYKQIGLRKRHPKRFRLKLRYNNYKEAKAALDRAVAAFKNGRIVVIDVNATVPRRTSIRENRPLEVRIDW